METLAVSTIAGDVALFLEELKKYHDKPKELHALFYAALRFAIRKNAGDNVFDEIIKASIGHQSLQSACLVIVERSSRVVQDGLRQAIVGSGTTMDAIEIAAKMHVPLSREEIVLLGNRLRESHEPLTSAKILIGYAESQHLSELDMHRLRTKAAEIERSYD